MDINDEDPKYCRCLCVFVYSLHYTVVSLSVGNIAWHVVTCPLRVLHSLSSCSIVGLYNTDRLPCTHSQYTDTRVCMQCFGTYRLFSLCCIKHRSVHNGSRCRYLLECQVRAAPTVCGLIDILVLRTYEIQTKPHSVKTPLDKNRLRRKPTRAGNHFVVRCNLVSSFRMIFFLFFLYVLLQSNTANSNSLNLQ